MEAVTMAISWHQKWQCWHHENCDINRSPSGQIGLHFTDNFFRCTFIKKKVLYFDKKFHWALFLRLQLTITSIGLDDGLVPNRRQAIIWTNVDPIHWHIYVALGKDELMQYWKKWHVLYWNQTLVIYPIQTPPPLPPFLFQPTIIRAQLARLVVLIGSKSSCLWFLETEGATFSPILHWWWFCGPTGTVKENCNMQAVSVLNIWICRNILWVRSRNCGCLVTWFCYQLIAKSGNKTAAVPWPHPYSFVLCDFGSCLDILCEGCGLIYWYIIYIW